MLNSYNKPFGVWYSDSDPLRFNLIFLRILLCSILSSFLVQCYSFQSTFINDLLTFRHSHSSRPKFTSMIAVVEFRTKKATRSWYMLTQKVAIFWLSKSKIFSLKNIKLWEELLLQMLFNYFHFLKSEPNFRRAPINPNRFWWKNNWCIIYQWAYAYSL